MNTKHRRPSGGLPKRLESFTLLEFLVATFLATLLLVMIYQAFGQVARHFRLVQEEMRSLEGGFFRAQLLALKASPFWWEDRLYLPLETPLGPAFAVYDLREGLYAETLSPKEELTYVFPEKGLKELKVYALRAEGPEEIDLEKPWPKETLFLVEVEFWDGLKEKMTFWGHF